MRCVQIHSCVQIHNRGLANLSASVLVLSASRAKAPPTVPAAPSAEASRSAANALPKSKDEVAEARPKAQRAPLGELPRNAAAIVG